MIETWQILLVSVVTILTILLTVIGVQIVYILKEIRETIGKINHIAADAGKITKSISSAAGSVSGFSAGMKMAVGFLSLLKRHTNNLDKDKKK